MSEEADMPGLSAKYHELRGTRDERPTLLDAGPERAVRRLTSAVFAINDAVIRDFGGRKGEERIRGGTESAIGAAFQVFGGEELHLDPFKKAAVIFRGITGGHTLVDGNKRTGFLTSALFLDEAGFPMPEVLPEGVYQFCLDISSGVLRDLPEITTRYRELWGVEQPVT